MLEYAVRAFLAEGATMCWNPNMARCKGTLDADFLEVSAAIFLLSSRVDLPSTTEFRLTDMTRRRAEMPRDVAIERQILVVLCSPVRRTYPHLVECA